MTVKENRVPFEEALDMTAKESNSLPASVFPNAYNPNLFKVRVNRLLLGYSRYNLCTFLLSSSIIVGMTFEIFSISYLVPASVCELNTSSTQQGVIACVPLIGSITSSYIWGYLADTKGRRKILIISMTMSYIAGTTAAFSPNWIVFSFLKLISSASVSGSFALSVTLLSECTPAAKRSSLILLTTSVHLFSLGVMGVVVIPILPLTFSYSIPFLGIYFNSWRLLDLIFAVPCAVSAVGCLCAYESPKYLVSAGRDEEALEVLKGMYVMNTGKSADTYKVESLELDEAHSSSLDKGCWGSIVAQTAPMIKPPLLKNTILLSFLFAISYITMNAFFVWLPFILNAFMLSVVEGERSLTICEMIRQSANSSSIYEAHNCSMNSAAMMLVFGINTLLSFCNIFMSSIIKCIGRKALFIGIQMVAGLSALFINLSPYWILSAIMFTVFLSATFNFGFLNTFSVDVFPTYVKAMAVCLTLMVGRGSAVIGINMLKRLLDNNCEAAFYIYGSIAFGGGIVGLLLPSDAKIIEQKKMLKT